jgi:RHS repeat-associated protein
MNKKILNIKFFCLCLLIVFLVYVIIDFIHTGRDMAKCMQCHGKMNQLSCALTNYVQKFHHLPPCIVIDNNHVPLHSWRTLLSQNCLECNLYDYNFNEKWNSDNNTKSLQYILKDKFGLCNFFQCPFIHNQDVTNYVAVTTKSGDWYTSLCQDNLNDDILLIICDSQSQIKITEPKDITLKQAWDILKKRKLHCGLFGNYIKNEYGIFWRFSENSIICRKYDSKDLLVLEELQLPSNRLYREDVAATNAGKSFDELYSYDGMNQLIDMQRGTLGANKASIVSQYKHWEEQFTFDATGNFAHYKQDANGDGTFDLNQNRVHNNVNEITSIAGSTSLIASDRNGNMTKIPKPDNWSAAYDLVYDAWNRLVTVKSGSTIVATYFYDGTNRRVKKIVGNETRLFYFNKNWQCIEEYVGNTCDVRFVWGLRYVDDLVTYRNASTDYYVLQDANWNVIGLTNVSGVVQEHYTYTSFGKLNVFDAAFVPKSASTFSLTRSFTGQVLDAETGLMLYRNRGYHPTLGRFLQRDPVGYNAGDSNIYRELLKTSFSTHMTVGK